MFTIAQPTVRTMATSFAASALLTTLAIAGSASPAHAATRGEFVRQVENALRTDNSRRVGEFAPSTNVGVATVAVRIDAAGKVVDTGIARSSGHAELDNDALLAAKSVHYPKGTARTIAVVMKYGNAKLPTKSETAWVVSRYVNARGEALASGTPAPNAG